VKSSVQGLVDQLNALLTKIDGLTAPATSTAKAGALSGDPTARSLRSALINTVFGVDGRTSMASLGIQTDRYGKLVFDEAAFDTAYAADPVGVMKRFTTADTSADPTVAHPDGWAALVQTVAKNASDPFTGTVTAAITGSQSSIDRLGDDIAAWDDRLALRRESLNQQFTALETALSSLKSQGDWLSGQLASLPSSSS
jgi:flagellar hook-associated protein 2